MQSRGLDSLFKGCDSSILQTTRRPIALPSKRHAAWKSLQERRLAINTPLPQHHVAHKPQKETKGLKTSFLTRLFCPGKIAKLKGGHCRDHPQTPTWQPRIAPLHGTRGTPTLYLDSLRGAYGTLKPTILTISSLVRICCPDPALAT